MAENKERPNVRIQLCTVREENGFLVEIFSKNFIRDVQHQGFLPAKTPRIRSKIAVLAGALAEEQNEKIMQNHDPDEIAKIAEKTFDELMLLIDTTNARCRVAQN